MTIHEKMKMTAAELYEKLCRGEKIDKKELKFLNSWIKSQPKTPKK